MQVGPSQAVRRPNINARAARCSTERVRVLTPECRGVVWGAGLRWGGPAREGGPPAVARAPAAGWRRVLYLNLQLDSSGVSGTLLGKPPQSSAREACKASPPILPVRDHPF